MNSVSARPGADWPVAPAPGPASLVAILGIAAILSVVASGVLPLAKFMLVAVVCAYTAWHVYRLLAPPWKTLCLDDNFAMLADQKGRKLSIQFSSRSFVSPLFLGFTCRSDRKGKTLPVGLFRSQLEHEAFRRLSVMLRQGGNS